MKALLSRVAALAAVDVAALVLLWPTVRRVVLTSDAVLHGSTDAFAADVAEVGLFAVALWLGLGLVAVALTVAPGLVGRIGDTLSGVLLPGLLRRALAGGVGLGMLIAPVLSPTQAVARQAVAAPVTMHSPSGPPSPSDTQPTPLPPPVWPTTVPMPTSPAPRIDNTLHPSARTRTAVMTGDSLWLIAQRRLGPDATAAQVAAYWPRVYRRNRSLIGADPDVISPGQQLTLPAPSAKESAR